MPKPIHDRGMLRPVEIARLQRVFDETCLRRAILPESPAARELALTLLALHDAGMSDEQTLLDAVAFPLPDKKTA